MLFHGPLLYAEIFIEKIIKSFCLGVQGEAMSPSVTCLNKTCEDHGMNNQRTKCIFLQAIYLGLYRVKHPHSLRTAGLCLATAACRPVFHQIYIHAVLFTPQSSCLSIDVRMCGLGTSTSPVTALQLLYSMT